MSLSGGIAPAHSGESMSDSALESDIAQGILSPRVGPMPQLDREGMSWDLFDQLLRSKLWEADANRLRRPADVLAWGAGKAASQSSTYLP